MSSVGKLQRNYRLSILTPDQVQIEIAPPFSIEFQITRNTLSSANKGTITLYNLGPSTRNRVFKDRFSVAEYFRVVLFAGYGNRLHEVFRGNILEAYSYREQTNWITEISAFDGMDAIQNGFTSQSFAANTPRADIIRGVINTMPNMVAGILGTPAAGQSPRGQAFVGQSTEIINELTDGNYFIDGEALNVLSPNEALPEIVTRLDSSLLLETPRRREALLEVTTLFEPVVQVGQIYEIDTLNAIFNGQYIVQGFRHTVTISEAMGGDARTELQLFFGTEGIREAQPL